MLSLSSLQEKGLKTHMRRGATRESETSQGLCEEVFVHPKTKDRAFSMLVGHAAESVALRDCCLPGSVSERLATFWSHIPI